MSSLYTNSKITKELITPNSNFGSSRGSPRIKSFGSTNRDENASKVMVPGIHKGFPDSS